MDQQEIKTLRLFEALVQNGFQSQRELSKKLGISLGLVNSLLKRIIKKGFFKVISVDKNGLKYVLTPTGMTEKAVLTYRFISYSLNYYKEIKKRFENLFGKFEAEKKENVIIFGGGELSEIAVIVINGTKLNLVRKIENENCLAELVYDIILIVDIEKHMLIKKKLINIGISKDKIITLQDFD